jgi:hypothetical protein
VNGVHLGAAGPSGAKEAGDLLELDAAVDASAAAGSGSAAVARRRASNSLEGRRERRRKLMLDRRSGQVGRSAKSRFAERVGPSSFFPDVATILLKDIQGCD